MVGLPFERSAVDAAASLAGGNVDCAGAGKTSVVLHKGTVATHTGVTSVEHR